MGDNSFVSSFRMSKGVKELPEDFWQLKGVYLWNNGNLSTINRRADNAGIHHLSYELRNGKIELFGEPNDVLVEYFTKPKKLFYKPSAIAITLPSDTDFIDCCGHCFLYQTTDTEQNDVLAVHDVDGIKSVVTSIAPGTNNYLTKDFIVTETDGDITIYDLASGNHASIENASPIVTENGDLYVLHNEEINRVSVGDNTYTLYVIQSVEIALEGSFIVCDNEFTDFYSIVNGVLYHNAEEMGIAADKLCYSDKKCYFLANSFGYVDVNNYINYIDYSTGHIIGFVGINERTGYGYATKKFSSYYIEPYCEDTELNFPNSTYYQIIAYMIAIAFRCKQGADITLLSTQLSAIEQTFEETMGSDAFQFPRMGNVYK